MNSKSKSGCEFEDDEIFDDSSFLDKLDSSSFKETRFPNSTIANPNIQSELNVSALCCDEEISGYDKLTGKVWIYPTNYSVRDYQFNIIKAAILKNTLVSLPTGLGKTFIAAVIMYNFYRWYPLGKIIFTAPTRPLVAQQIDACYNIIAIPPNDTIEMTGHMQVNTRKSHWQTKRVFFATPQVIYNDIKSGICPGDKIRCLVIDEAHRSRGNYAYCQIVSTLTDMGHKTYRILALSATPGSKVEDVINVVKSLQIAHLELRTENCIDVAPYSHSRKISTVVIALGPELTQLRQQYVEILDTYARRLKQFNILPQNLGNLSKGRIVMLYKEFQTKERGARHPQHNYIMKDFTLLIALYHGLELLVKHGTRVFLNFFDEHPEKSWIQSDDKLTALLERLRDDLGLDPLSLNTSILPDGTIPEIPKNISFGHPKFYKLKEIMLEHFTVAKKKGQDTRAIVFCEYRESVNLVNCLLLQCRPLITPQMFVGQGASGKDGKTVVSQKQQLRVMRSFREGGCNTLVATCVAEEGLDVGSVDLILCFDVSSRSPVRLVQRCGRTGRERGGQVFILVTEGREHQTLLDCMRQRDGLNKKIMQSIEVKRNLYQLNPRMMPHDFTPECQKMFITVAKKTDPKEKPKDADKAKKGQKDLRTMLLGKSISSSSASSRELETTDYITEEEYNSIFPLELKSKLFGEKPLELWAMHKEKIKQLIKTEDNNHKQLSTWLEWQRTLQKTINIGHSRDSEIMSELLQCSDAKRFELPASTQNPTFNTQDFLTQTPIMSSPIKSKTSKTKKIKSALVKSPLKVTKSPSKRDGDIRALFSTATKSTKNYTKLISDLGIQNNGSIPTRLINLLVDLSVENTNSTKICYICQNVCECSFLNIFKGRKKMPPLLNLLSDPKLPEINLIDDFDLSLLNNMKKIDSESKNINNIQSKIGTNNGKDEFDTNNFDLDFNFSSLEVSPEIKEKTQRNMETNTHVKSNFELELDLSLTDDIELISTAKSKEEKQELDNNFEIGDIDDIFAESSPEEIKHKDHVTDTKEQNPENQNEALGFFGLNSIDDIFADYDESIDNKPNEENSILNQNDKATNNEIVETKNIAVSPSILSGKPKNLVSTSPILCSQSRKFQLSTKKKSLGIPASKAKRQLINDSLGNISTINDTEHKATITKNSLIDTTNKSMFTITQLVELINKPNDQSSICKQSNLTSKPIIIDDRSTSPILLTQADKKKATTANVSQHLNLSTHTMKSGSLIILDSDSESSNDTQIYEVSNEDCKHISHDENKNETSEVNKINCKRKLEVDDDDFMTASPYFSKKQKLDNANIKPLSLQEKVLAAISSSKINDIRPQNNPTINFNMSSYKDKFQKENKNPQYLVNDTQCDSDDEKVCNNNKNNKLSLLHMFKRNSQVASPKDKFNQLTSNGTKKLLTATQKRKLSFDDSDDDFEYNKRTRSQIPKISLENKHKTNQKPRKKKMNSFLELEAEVSDSCSGDELSDTSVGSLADFVCDEQPQDSVDMHAHYIRSIKGSVNGVFKIPQLPNKFDKMEVFSQYVEEDSENYYEMDSFCVDSHIGLTQVNDVSELELAEIILKEKKKRKKMGKSHEDSDQDNGDSPIVRRKWKNNRQIRSDSDDSD